MKKIFILLVLSLCFQLVSSAQGCAPCPELIIIRDTLNCNFVEMHSNAPASTYSNTDSTSIRVCRNSTMTYTLKTLGFGTTGICDYPTFHIDTILVQGGVLVNNTNSSYTINWGNGNTGTVQIQFSIPGSAAGGQGCNGVITIHYTLVPNPIAAFTSSPNPACFNNPTNITFNSSGSVGANSYFWDFGDGFTSTAQNPVHPYTSPGTYTVCLTVSTAPPAGGNGTIQVGACPSCAATVCHNVVIDNLPGPDITCIATVCAGESATYCTSASCSTYNWVVTGGVITSPPNAPCITVQWGSGNPQGNIHLDVPGCPGFCSQGTDITVPIIPTTTTILGPTIVCVGATNSYSLPTLPGTTYNWVISGGQTINGNNTNTSQINTTWNNIGTYTITCVYYDTALNCGGTGTIIVNVLPEMKVTGPVKRCAGTTGIYHSAVVSPAFNVNSNWTISPAVGASVIGGNGTSFATISWTAPGTYVVTATPTVSNVVCSPVSYTVVVYPQPILSAIVGADSICANGIGVYSATSNMAGLYTWTIIGGTATNLGANNDSVQINWNPNGPYSITVTQSSYANNCVSNSLTKAVFAYPNPAVSGSLNVCADNIENYVITNIGTHNFNWHVTPAQFGTVVTENGNTVQIKWHGNNNPGVPHTVYLHYGFCKDDSIAIVINDPIAPVITKTGTLCGPGGVTLSSSGSGSFSWSHLETPPYSSFTSTLTNINDPGHYTVQIGNYGGTTCTVTATYNLPSVGLPVAQIYAGGPIVYCAPALPNMYLHALTGPGYTYQWFQNNVAMGGITAVDSILINSGNIPAGTGTYDFYCNVILNGCVVASNHVIINVINCPTGGGGVGTSCPGAISLTNITGCNPFVVTAAVTNGAYIIPGTMSITHFEDGLVLSGNTTRNYTSIGLKSIRVCVDVKMNDSSTCTVCKDTTVLVNLAANFLKNVNCGTITLTNQSTIFSPATIVSHAWTVSPSGTFSNPAGLSPTLTVTSSGTYTITLTETSSTGCTASFTSTVNITLPDANFTVSNSCVGTTVNLNNLFPAPTNYWNFGDLTSSNTSPTFHAYAAANSYLITHTVTDIFGCTDTKSKPIIIVPAPTCTITYAGSTSFCSGNNLPLNACPGYAAYQWFNNGNAISGATSLVYNATQTGNYTFSAVNPSGCDVSSDTVSITVLQSPSTVMSYSGQKCDGQNFSVSVPACNSCFYAWEVDGTNVQSGPSNSLSGIVGSVPFLLGPHVIKVTIFGSNGCSSVDSVNVVFNPQPTIAISVTGNPPQLCSNNLYILNASSNAASPAWAWTYNNNNNILASTYSLTASSAGTYHVLVTDGITGCTNTATQSIDPSPDLTLFPIGCDTLCNNATVFLPLASFNGNIAGYTINWYDNAPPYSPIIGTGASLNLNTLALGPHNLSVIVTGPNGCVDTSNVYYIYIVPGTSSNTTAAACGSYTWTVNGVTYTASGTYTSSTINGSGCPQNDTLNLTISTSTIVTTTITACDSYTWPLNGVTYTASGTYTVQNTLPNGCVEIHKLILIINQSTDVVTNATACASYTWAANGVTYTTSGTYSFTTLNAVGCTQHNILNMIISTGTSTVTNASACGSYTWTVNGVTYTASGTYTHTVQLASGCIQTDSLILTINSFTTSSTTISACNSYTWPVNGITYTLSGTYTFVTIDPTGCDHVDTLHLTIHHVTDSVLNVTTCGTYTWPANGVTYTASGTYTFTSLNANGCTQFNILHLTLTGGTSTSVTATACGSYTWPVNGVTYTISGNYTATMMNAVGCVDTVHLSLIINHNTSNTQTVFSCDMYTWSVNGVTYTASGTYTHTSVNANGCVHTSTLVLTIGTTTVITSYIVACGSYTWPINGVTYTAGCVATVIVYSGTDCPHLYVLCLTILPNTSSSTSITACDHYTWPVTGQTYSNSGVYTQTSLNANGCTHTDSLVLTIHHSSSSTVSATACNSYTWPLNGVTYTASGSYTFTSINAEGCPHVTTLNLTIITGTNNTINVVACDSYTWFGTTYTVSGNYTHTSLNANGCIQTTTLHLTINTTTVITSYVTACGSYTWTVNGVTYTASGSYMYMTIGANGCPKLYVLCLTIYQNTSTTVNITACNSYTWPVNSVTYTASGTYTYTSLNANGCVNTATLVLIINQSTTSTATVVACDSYLWSVNGVTYTVSGIYTATSLNTQGCINTATLNLTINHGAGSTTTITVCNEYTWPINGVTYTASGVYSFTSLNANGCTNTHTLNLTIHHSTNSSSTITACDSYTWPANGVTYTLSGTYTYTTLNAEGCVHTNTLHLTINTSNHSTVNVIGCDAYTWVLNGVTYTASGTYTHTSQNTNGCIDRDTLILTMGTTTTTHIFDTACCEYTWGMNGVTYSQSGIYPYVTTGPDGCPHIYILCVTVYPCTPITSTVITCGTYTWPVNGITYTTSGTYTTTGLNSYGCPVTQTLILTLGTGVTTTSACDTACDFYYWALNGVTYTTSGVYTYIVNDTNGCPHIYIKCITIRHHTESVVNATAATSYTWNANGQTYTASGNYTATLVNSVNCDSILTLHLQITGPSIPSLAPKALLSGPYQSNTGLMTDSLRVQGLIPLTEPYSSAPFYFIQLLGGGGETTTPAVLSVTGNNAIVDWVYIEIRSASNMNTVIATKNALLQRDGDIVGVDGFSPLNFPMLTGGNYYVSVKHRNHLGMMTATPVSLNFGTQSVDFTSIPLYTMSSIVNNGPANFTGSVQLMWSGDPNHNKNVKYNGSVNDKDPILMTVGMGTPNNTVYGYRLEDLNMDGKIRYNNTDNDRVLILNNVGASTPNKVLSQHTPN